MINVIVADDHAVVRTGLQLFFQGNKEVCIADEAKNGDELLVLLKTNTYQAAIVDLNMPGKDSFDLIREILKDYPTLPIIILSMNSDELLIKRLFKLGVKAFINKEESPDEIYNAVIQVAKNKKYLTAQQQQFFATQFISDNDDENIRHSRLSDREYQIMSLLVSGKSNTQIAKKLNISKNTLSNHRNNILKKIQVQNIVELTKYAMQYHLIN